MTSTMPQEIVNDADLLGRLRTPTGFCPSAEQREEQLISFVYGNLPSNSKLDRNAVSDKIKRTQFGG